MVTKGWSRNNITSGGGVFDAGGNSAAYTAGTESLLYTIPANATNTDGGGEAIASEYAIQPFAGDIAAAFTPNTTSFYETGMMAFKPAN